MATSLKAGVQLTGLRPEMVLATLVIADIFAGLMRDCVITSAVDGQHSETSLHYTGLALDFRTRDLTPDEQQVLLQRCREMLGAEFDVVLETDHLHVEHDPDTTTLVA